MHFPEKNCSRQTLLLYICVYPGMVNEPHPHAKPVRADDADSTDSGSVLSEISTFRSYGHCDSLKKKDGDIGKADAPRNGWDGGPGMRCLFCVACIYTENGQP